MPLSWVVDCFWSQRALLMHTITDSLNRWIDSSMTLTHRAKWLNKQYITAYNNCCGLKCILSPQTTRMYPATISNSSCCQHCSLYAYNRPIKYNFLSHENTIFLAVRQDLSKLSSETTSSLHWHKNSVHAYFCHSQNAQMFFCRHWLAKMRGNIGCWSDLAELMPDLAASRIAAVLNTRVSKAGKAFHTSNTWPAAVCITTVNESKIK